MRFEGTPATWALSIAIFTVSTVAVPDCRNVEGGIGPTPPYYPIRPPLTIDFDEDFISGHFTLTDAGWEGLETVVDFLELDCTSTYPLITATVEIKLEFLKLSGIYELGALINSPFLQIFGTGDLFLRFDTPYVNLTGQALHANGSADGLQGKWAAIELGLEGLSFHADGLEICGEGIEPWGPIFIGKSEFDQIWAMVKGGVDELLSAIAQITFDKCTLTELLEGDANCMSLGPMLAAAASPKVLQFLAAAIRPHLASAQSVMQMLDIVECEPPPTQFSTTITTTSSTTTAPSSAIVLRRELGLWNFALIAMAVFPTHCIFSANH